MWIEVLAWLCGVTTLFWLVILMFWGDLFFAEKLEAAAQERSEEAADAEAAELRSDLTRRIAIMPVTFEKGVPRVEKKMLADLGIAENRGSVRRDADNEVMGDHWLCNGRPIGFAVLQIILGYGPALVLSLVLVSPAAALLGFLTATLFLIVTSWVEVPERTRVGVFRFKRLLSGMLRPGLHFIILPWFSKLFGFEFERVAEVRLQRLVWGPHPGHLTEEERKMLENETGVVSKVLSKEEKHELVQMHLPGHMGTTANPQPGLFVVQLHGRWPLKVLVAISLFVRRSSKLAWRHYLVSYTRLEEVGELIAAAASGVLTTRAREIQRSLRGEDGAEGEVVSKLLEEYLNRIPEIAADIMLALQQLTRESLAGFIIEKVVFADQTPSEKLRQLLQSLDESGVERERQKREGEAAKERLQELRSFTEEILGSEAAVRQAVNAGVIRLEELDVLRQFIKGRSDVEALLKAFSFKQAFSATASSEKKEQPEKGA